MSVATVPCPGAFRRCSSLAAMRFTYAESMTDPSFYMPLAQAAEGAGFHAMTIADRVAYPFESGARTKALTTRARWKAP